MHGVFLQARRGARHSRSKARKAFTLLELLVVLGICGFLLSVTLPAVQTAREAARLSVCRNHLRQLALAIHHFHDVEGHLPAADLADGWATWGVFLLPHVDQSSAYMAWDLGRQYYAQPPAAGVNVPIFYCPSRVVTTRPRGTGDSRYYVRDGFRTGPIGWSDYAGVAGTDIDQANGVFLRALDRRTGRSAAIPILSVNTEFRDWSLPLAFRNVTDGLSTTLLFGEKHLAGKDSDPCVFNGDDVRGYIRVCGIGRPIVHDPYAPAPDGSRRFGSPHPGACCFAKVDGSAQAVNARIDVRVLQALATRSGCDVVTDY